VAAASLNRSLELGSGIQLSFCLPAEELEKGRERSESERKRERGTLINEDGK
jgi:hypothetical protein